MAPAAIVKRHSSLNGDGEDNATKLVASVGAKAASVASSSAAKSKSMQTTAIQVAPHNATVSEKRRIAALISWEKRREKAAKGAAAASKRKASVSVLSAIPVTPPKAKGKKRAMQKKPEPSGAPAAPPAKKRKVDVAPSGRKASKKSMSSIRREAAKLGWERRKKQVASAEAESSGAGSSASDDASSADERPSIPSFATTDTNGSPFVKRKVAASRKNYSLSAMRQATAVQGGEKKRKDKDATAAKKDATAIRKAAAKLGWERRRKLLLAAESSSVGSSADDASSADEAAVAVESTSHVKIVKKKGGGAAAASSSRKVYSAAERRQAAIRGWERRNSGKSSRSSTVSSSTPDVVVSYPTLLTAAVAPPTKEVSSKPSHQPKKETKEYRQGTKRSRRLAVDSGTSSYEDEVRKINELVTYLRVSRGWMEFHPSSRHGSGTATYGYIPSSIATFIRTGTISQSTVLDKGVLGVHYALDWDGYGGLKDMITTFGGDYSPYPTEEMMDMSRVTEWELGEDLPWREVEEAEERKLKDLIAIMEQESGVTTRKHEADEDMEDIKFFANILANLDRSAVADNSDLEEDISNGPSKTISQEGEGVSPSLLALLQNYESSSTESSDGGYNSDTEECKKQNQEKDALSNFADVTVMKECEEQCKPPPTKIVDDNVLIIQSRQAFKNWNFGLC